MPEYCEEKNENIPCYLWFHYVEKKDKVIQFNTILNAYNYGLDTFDPLNDDIVVEYTVADIVYGMETKKYPIHYWDQMVGINVPLWLFISNSNTQLSLGIGKELPIEIYDFFCSN